jgi:excisionase family DNA binding protein
MNHVLTLREVAEVLRVGKNKPHELIAQGDLRAVRIGGSVRVTKSALLEFLGESETAEPPSLGPADTAGGSRGSSPRTQ